MYGAILGDLIGSIYEYSQVQKIESIQTDELLTEKSFYSDDTILTIAVLDAILHDRNYDTYLRKYIQEYGDYKPDFKPYFPTPFSPGLTKWSKGNEIGESHGNGAMMRISPVGYMFDTEEEVVENARLATIPSHNAKVSIDSATTIALIIFYLRKGYSKEEVFDKLKLSPQYIPFENFNVTCETTIDNCLYTFYHSNSLEDAFHKTLLMGGDTDTNCAIVGSMAEALYGIDSIFIEKVNEKIPKEFVKVLEQARGRY